MLGTHPQNRSRATATVIAPATGWARVPSSPAAGSIYRSAHPLRGIKTHGEVGRPFRCRQPIRFFVSAGAFFLEIEVEGPVRVVFERHSAADGEPVEAVGALGTPQRRDLLG